ncbi:phage tail terminator-like protein [Azospirillum sp. TSO5]|uniref:phage tail terminator-like protein n=1 Tax=Azospirillum sp. TSO5 TaxID=716760 RepID=UPI000D60AE38|nr:phage tail terminator-like protein [Azospirillum sp. TSO5]PWC95458.1 hypothetical protein TSO5_10570 [Azospirillum sp. TSO5]
MSAISIQTAFDTLLDSSQSAAIDIAWFGRAFTPQIGMPYLRPSMLACTSAPQGAGANGTILWSGRYQLLLNYPAASGPDDAGQKAEELRVVFRRGLNLPTSDGWAVVVENTEVPPPMQGDVWLTQPVLVRWWALEFPT